jgi:hypothetical protein
LQSYFVIIIIIIIVVIVIIIIATILITHFFLSCDALLSHPLPRMLFMSWIS